jgi:hypothetical protein
MNGNANNLWWFKGCCLHAAALVIEFVAPDRQLFHLVQNIPSIQDLPKNCVQIVEMWLLLVQDKEL